MNELSIWVSVIGLILAFSGSGAALFFRMGQHSTRLKSLEDWRIDVRRDMHEISGKLTQVITEIHGIKTLCQERMREDKR